MGSDDRLGTGSERAREADPRIRFDVKSAARVWDYWLGGKDNYEIDRKAGDEYRALFPDIVKVARADRRFLVNAVTYLAGEAGVRQFLDIGTGLPTMQNTHEVAQVVAPDARIVYVDNDPIVLAHARALLTNVTAQGVTDYLDADVREPGAILARAASTLDFDRPVAVLLLGVLGHAAATFDEMDAIVRRLLAGLCPGSYLALGDGVDLGHTGQRDASDNHAYRLRTPEQFSHCLRGLELVEPGLVPVNHWRTPHTGETPLNSYVALGRIP